MSEPILISPLLDGFLMGEPISDHNGIRCCPAMDSQSSEKYFVKIISLPPTSAQLEAMLLAGAFSDEASAVKYYEERANDYIREIEVLQQLSRQEGFIPCCGYQSVSSQEHIGFDVYILNKYMRSLERQFTKKPITHLQALNMSLDICSALAACRRSGYIYANLKPTNIFVTENGEYKISDLGFIHMSGLKYAALPENCISAYTPPEIVDAYSSVNDTLDVYALGMILYRIFNGDSLPENKEVPLSPPQYADEELASIILKACSINPEERWRDPAQMGQMLVAYIQKNGTFDTPVVPLPVEPDIIPEEPVTEETPIDQETAETQDVLPEAEMLETENEETLPAADDIPVDQEIMTEAAPLPQEDGTEISDVPEEVSDVQEAVDLPSEETTQEAMDMPSEEIMPETDEIPATADASEPVTEEAELVSEEEAEASTAPVPVEILQEEVNSEEPTDIPEQPAEVAVETIDPTLEVVPELPDNSPVQNIEEVEPETSAEITPEMAESQLMDILEKHDAFSQEVAEIKAAAAYLELDRAPDQIDAADYDGVTDEVSEILSQADDLVALDVPAPAVAPEASEIVLEIPQEEEDSAETEPETPTPEIEITEEDIDMKSNEKPRRSHLVRNIIIIVLLLLLLAGGALFYQYIVIQTVDQLEVTGVKDQLIVQVSSEADESLLTISCEDKYGQKSIVPVYQGTAEFTGLRADSQYTIEVHIAGLHILQGNTKETYTTPNETVLLQHSVITGNEPGSAILNFTIEGPDSDRWNFTYSTDGYPEKTTSFQGTSVTLTDLLPNKVYKGALTPEADLFITKPMEIEFTASELIQANNLKITGCSAGKLTVAWDAPENTTVESWTVRCYSGKDGSSYDQTVTTSKTSHEFKGLNSTESFTVEVTAVGQTMVQKVSIPANSVTVTKLTADTSIAGVINLKWESGGAPKNGWTISYSINGSDNILTANSKEKSAVIKPVVPNTEYTVTIASADSVHTFCDEISVTTMATEEFSIDINNKKITAADIQVSLFKQPTADQWDYTTLKDSDYTNKFATGDKAGLLLYLKKEYEDSAAEMNATFVIYNDKGEIIQVASKDAVWNKAWTKNNCIFNIPTMPQEAGFYKIALYLNSQLVSEHDFSIA